MAGLFALSIDSKKYKRHFTEDLFWGTCYQQHLSQDFGGMSCLKESEIISKTKPGLFFSNFQNELNHFEGKEGIGCCSTAPEPYFIQSSRFGPLALCFSGNIINIQNLIEKLKRASHSFDRGDDVEVVEKLISKEKNISQGIKRAVEEIEGSFNLLILSKGGIYALRSPRGTWPLVVGIQRGAVAIASDPSGLSNLNFEILRDLEPGEIALLKDGKIETLEKLPASNIQICSFLWVYYLYPAAIIEGVLSAEVRYKLGIKMAQRDIKEGFIPDIITIIPDSSRHFGLGYKQEFDRANNESEIEKVPIYDETFLKYGHIGRSFVFLNKDKRKEAAFYKQILIPGNYQGKNIVICDDSTVRGTQLETDLIPKARQKKPEQIHCRISNPEILSYCCWGKATKKEELFSIRHPTQKEKLEKLGIQSIKYSSIEDLIEAIGLPREKLCIDCDLQSE